MPRQTVKMEIFGCLADMYVDGLIETAQRCCHGRLEALDSALGVSKPSETYLATAERLEAQGEDGYAAIYRAMEARWWEVKGND